MEKLLQNAAIAENNYVRMLSKFIELLEKPES